MRHFPLTPATARLSIVCGVILKVSALIASVKPGTTLSRIERVASGVVSRGPSPVPPVVRIRSIPPSSAHSASLPAITAASSGTTSYLTTWLSSEDRLSLIALPLSSRRCPRQPLSLIVSMPMLSIMLPFLGHLFYHI
ncbi:hypothetical protein ES703_96778 [subsurface metagenome]